MKNYTLDEMLKMFETYSKEYEKWAEEHAKNFPGLEPPYDYFDINKVFSCLIKEIKALKDDASKKTQNS